MLGFLFHYCMAVTKRAFLIILDGVGVGALPDARTYGDEGSNTLGNTAEAVGGLNLPNLERLGLGKILPLRGVCDVAEPVASFGRAAEISKGKDSTTGHWEIAGLITEREFPTYPHGFPADLMKSFIRETGCGGFLGNTTASGTAIIQELGAGHVRTGFPIVYTSADSVFQIAAHEEVIPLGELYRICTVTREKVCTGRHAVSRVIARPFLGDGGEYVRTTNRRDFSVPPPGRTLLDDLSAAGVPTISVGKVDDLFAGRGLQTTHHTRNNGEGIDRIIECVKSMTAGFVFANLVDFDTLYGHRNDPAGFASALVEFDNALPRILGAVRPGDLVVITADHGNDPVSPGTDHSREYVPLLVVGGAHSASLGTRATFADIGKTIAEFFGVSGSLAGESFFGALG